MPWLVNSTHWQLVKKFTLRKNVRVDENADDYAEWILKIGKGLQVWNSWETWKEEGKF